LFFWQGKDLLLAIAEDFPKHAVGTILVGIGYCFPAILYELERPALLLKAAIHFFVGTITFFFVSTYLAWIPLQSSRHIIGELFISCATFAAIWSGFYLLRRREAKQINNRLQELEKQTESKR
ncbi:MAG: DUF3021 domain-containing protein, partial [Oscillospiraceae bacterium]|nr:DUF3021 domain-containing protein [Oscillospiraceae bacterium]